MKRVVTGRGKSAFAQQQKQIKKLCESQGGKEEKTFRDLLMLSYALVKD